MAKGLVVPLFAVILFLSIIFAAIDVATGRAIQIAPGSPGGGGLGGGAGSCPEGEVYIDGICVGGGNYWVKVSITGPGDGTVISSPAGIGGGTIKCNPTCGAVYSKGTVVTLTVAAGADSKFVGWLRAGVVAVGGTPGPHSGAEEMPAPGVAGGVSWVRLAAAVRGAATGGGTRRSAAATPRSGS